MSIFRSYFSKNNIIQKDSFINSGRNPVMQLFFGQNLQPVSTDGFSRFIFDLNLTPLIENIISGVISTGCTSAMTHTLKMTNTSSFDTNLLNTEDPDGFVRATSFDLILFRIPKTSGSTGNSQNWDEGVGYDYVDTPALDSWGFNKAFLQDHQTGIKQQPLQIGHIREYTVMITQAVEILDLTTPHLQLLIHNILNLGMKILTLI